jgi:hypothetical protein
MPIPDQLAQAPYSTPEGVYKLDPDDMVRWIRDDTLEQPAGFLHDRHLVPQVPEHFVPSR